MNLFIVTFLVIGALFGAATGRLQHRFSEGTTSPDKQGNRVLWVLICTFLWPLMALNGLHTWWRLARAPRRPSAAADGSPVQAANPAAAAAVAPAAAVR